jgi:hypothetical protein
MRDAKALASLLFLGMLVTVGLPNAKADEENLDTLMTFSAPVQVPGMVLEPGKYEFKTMGTLSNEVEIYNSKGQFMTMVRADPAYRLRTTSKTVVTFEKIEPGNPEALQTWYYPDRCYGFEFVYPKAEHMKMAGVKSERSR